MARIRTVKPEFWSSPDVGDVSRDARLTFIGLWNLADDKGRLEAVPAGLRGDLFPYDDDVTVEHLCGWINELARQGLVRLYAAGRRAYLHITGWEDHQRIDKPSQPRCPDPDDCRQLDGLTPTIQRDLGRSSDDLRLPLPPPSRDTPEAVPTPPAPERRNVGASERRTVGANTGTDDLDDGFREFWDCYPRRDGQKGGGASRKETLRSWRKLNDEQKRQALVGVAHFAGYCEQAGAPFVPHATTWLNQERWEQFQEPRTVESRAGPPSAIGNVTQLGDDEGGEF